MPNAARQCRRSKKTQEGLHPPYISNIREWSSVFSGIAVICNRVTPAHYDTKGYDESYDVLLTGGQYTDCWIKVEELDAEFLYNPGTLVGLCGKVFKHGVEDWAGGDRICYAHFIRDDVQAKQGCQIAPWVNMSDFKKHMSPYFASNIVDNAIRSN